MLNQEDHKITIAVDVTGRPASGKTTVIQYIANQLKSLGFDVEVNWGLDGEPQFSSKDPFSRLERVKAKSKIVITERQAPRGWSGPEPAVKSRSSKDA